MPFNRNISVAAGDALLYPLCFRYIELLRRNYLTLFPLFCYRNGYSFGQSDRPCDFPGSLGRRGLPTTPAAASSAYVAVANRGPFKHDVVFVPVGEP